MATTSDLLLDTLSRVREGVHAVLDSTPDDRLAEPPAPGTNTVAWLVWHLARVLDEQVAEVFGYPAVWEAEGWRERLALPLPPDAHGYGMSVEDMLLVRAPGADLRGYLDAAADAAEKALRTVTDADLDRVVDERWDPPVTAAVRLVSVLDDCTQHVGQAAYASGILSRS
ncbi:mycothiol transferase [Fodinibacter luteus]|uniref:Mycothiol transferase n=1 Tax=Fodinibacter luteus TaxID=552064 RepID=A0ABP8K2U4_9MICO